MGEAAPTSRPAPMVLLTPIAPRRMNYASDDFMERADDERSDGNCRRYHSTMSVISSARTGGCGCKLTFAVSRPARRSSRPSAAYGDSAFTIPGRCCSAAAGALRGVVGIAQTGTGKTAAFGLRFWRLSTRTEPPDLVLPPQ